jgi:cytochrome oxidase Cu insertion factor (SCO1/SenC/PrrC family)
MSEQAGQSRSRTKLFLLLLMFLLPVAGSWYLVFFTDYARDGEGVEHGDLIKPPRQLENAQLIRAGESTSEQTTLHGKWSMLFFVEDDCEASCEENLYRLRQIRLATGKEMLRVQRVAVVNENEGSLFGDYLSKNYPGQMYVSKIDLEENFLHQFQDLKLNDKTTIFLIDPRGFLMMRYSSETDPSGIIRDLSRLLRISSEG